MKNSTRVSILLFLLIVALSVFSISIGTVRIPISDIFSAFFRTNFFCMNELPASTIHIVKNIRLCRTLNAIFSGAILAVSGMIFQCIFRNQMADSYILGVSSGASAFISLAALLKIITQSSQSLPIFAFVGATITAILLFLFNRDNLNELLLGGIAVNFFLSACNALFLYLSRQRSDSIVFWTMGSFANSTPVRCFVLFVVLIIVLVISLKNSYTMDVLLFDDSTIISSGISLTSKRLFLLIVASVATAVVVSYCGIIGFIGLMCPHIMRLAVGTSHKKLILPCMLFGSLSAVFSDTIARIVLSPSELPVGIVTSFFGAPLFFVMLKGNFHKA